MSNGWDAIKHFKPVEFRSPDAPDSGYLMDLAFVAKLDKLRDLANIPLIIVSGYRTKEHNDKVGGVYTSAHTSGHAVDISAYDSKTRFEIMKAAFTLGFRRIGVGSSFVHVDDSILLPQDVAWVYPVEAKRGT